MFRLPVCPHCGTIYRYKDTINAIKKKDNECYHCGKSFKAKTFPGFLIAAIIPLILNVAINIFLLSRMKEAQLLPLFAVTMLFILIVFIIIPFFTRFVKTEKTEGSKRRN